MTDDKLSAKLEYLTKPTSLCHYCPACEMMHVVYLAGSNFPAKWDWNGNAEAPSFHPSLSHRFPWHRPPNHPNVPAGQDRVKVHCHYFIKDGMIQYCSDCTHTYAGKTIPLPDIPPDA